MSVKQRATSSIVADVNAYRAWLLALEPENFVGLTCTPCCYPVSMWLREVCGGTFLVQSQFVQCGYPSYSCFPAPSWVQQYNSTLDAQFGFVASEVYALTALEILDDLAL